MHRAHTLASAQCFSGRLSTCKLLQEPVGSKSAQLSAIDWLPSWKSRYKAEQSNRVQRQVGICEQIKLFAYLLLEWFNTMLTAWCCFCCCCCFESYIKFQCLACILARSLLPNWFSLPAKFLINCGYSRCDSQNCCWSILKMVAGCVTLGIWDTLGIPQDWPPFETWP